ncbi:MAG: acyl carrier protein [Caulobacter sp.]|nr:acyl carrier protein [Caulobacter sp.]
MDRQAVYKEISDFLVDTFEVPESELTPDADLVENLGLDSIDAVDLMVKLQEITGKKVTPEQFKSVRTINDVLDVVDQLSVDG